MRYPKPASVPGLSIFLFIRSKIVQDFHIVRNEDVTVHRVDRRGYSRMFLAEIHTFLKIWMPDRSVRAGQVLPFFIEWIRKIILKFYKFKLL